MRKILFILSFFSLFSAFSLSALAATSTSVEEAPKFKIPEFQVQIPGLKKLSTVNCVPGPSEGYRCEVPWLGEYVIALYNYGLSIAGILAALVLMAGGVFWLISGGDASKITQAKDLILGSITGLLILVCSYILLIQVNPDLIKFKSITIDTIHGDSYATPVTEQTVASTAGPSSHGVPWFFQCSSAGMSTLYNNKKNQCKPSPAEEEKYGAGKAPNICTSGCGVVSTLMVLGKYGQSPSLTQWTADVIEAGGRETYNGDSCNGSTAAGLIKAAKKYNLNGAYLSAGQIGKKLDEGVPVIISVRGPCPFTRGGHFIVLTGWRDKGKNIADVNDPFNSNKKAERMSISLNDYAGCKLNQIFYLYQ